MDEQPGGSAVTGRVCSGTRLCLCLAAALFLGPGRAGRAGGAEAAPSAEAITPRMHLPEPPRLPRKGPPLRTIRQYRFTKNAEGWSAAKGASLTVKSGVLQLKTNNPASPLLRTADMRVRARGAYRLSARVRLDAAPAGVKALSFRIQERDGKRKESARYRTRSAELSRVGRWQELAVEATLSPKAVHIYLALDAASKKSARIALSLTEIRLDLLPMPRADYRLRHAQLPESVRRARDRHPRLFFNDVKMSELRSGQQDPSMVRVARRLLGRAASYRRKGPPSYGKRTPKKNNPDPKQHWQRWVGDAIPCLAIAYRMTGKKEYLDGAVRFIRASCSYPTWGVGRHDGVGSATSHQLAGLALGYDWLYDKLSSGDRWRIRSVLHRRAGHLARMLMERKAWWTRVPLSSSRMEHCAALFICGLAVWEREPEAAGWVYFAHEALLQSLAVLPADGSYPHGAYRWEYAVHDLLRWADLAKTMLGMDLFEYPWWKQTAMFGFYNILPGALKGRSPYLVSLVGGHTWNARGPEHLLRRLAKQFRDERSQWLAARISTVGGGRESSAFLNFCWYQLTVTPNPPDHLPVLPTLRRFPDLDWVSARSDWTPEASLLAVRGGPPLGHANFTRKRDVGGDGNDPDCGAPVFYAYGEYLLHSPGWRKQRRSADHNVLLVNGAGQIGDGARWLDYDPWKKRARPPRVVLASSTPRADTVVLDLAPAYPEAAKLTRYRRTLLYIKPDLLVVLDEAATAEPAALEWRWHTQGTLAGPGEAKPYFSANGKEAGLDVAVLLPADAEIKAEPDPRVDPAGAKRGERRLLRIMPKEKTASALALCVFRARPLSPWDFPARFEAKREARTLTIVSGPKTWTLQLDPEADIPLALKLK